MSQCEGSAAGSRSGAACSTRRPPAPSSQALSHVSNASELLAARNAGELGASSNSSAVQEPSPAPVGQASSQAPQALGLPAACNAAELSTSAALPAARGLAAWGSRGQGAGSAFGSSSVAACCTRCSPALSSQAPSHEIAAPGLPVSRSAGALGSLGSSAVHGLAACGSSGQGADAQLGSPSSAGRGASLSSAPSSSPNSPSGRGADLQQHLRR